MLRYTCWALITLLLLQGSGMVSSLHRLSHHTQSQSLSSCDHAPGDQTPDRDDAPTPERDERNCPICLGLAGLHLAPIPDTPRLCLVPVHEADRVAPMRMPISRQATGEPPARAPPVC